MPFSLKNNDMPSNRTSLPKILKSIAKSRATFSRLSMITLPCLRSTFLHQPRSFSDNSPALSQRRPLPLPDQGAFATASPKRSANARTSSQEWASKARPESANCLRQGRLSSRKSLACNALRLCDNIFTSSRNLSEGRRSGEIPSLISRRFRTASQPQGMMPSPVSIQEFRPAHSRPNRNADSGGTKFGSPLARQRSCSGLKIFIEMDFSDEYKFNHNNYCSLGKIDLFCRNERKAVKRDRNVCKQRTVFLRSGTTSCGGEISAHQGEGPQHGTVHQGREGRDSARGRDSGPKGMHHTCENG